MGAYKGKTALVTGAASGIGASLAKLLAEYGCHLILADIQEERVATIANELASSGVSIRAVALDVQDYDAFRKLVEEIEQIDYLFNNAGIGIGGYPSDHGIQDWMAAIDVNLTGVINGVQCGYAAMRRQGSGHIINTASMAGLVASPAMIAYSASKSAIVALSKALRPEAREYGVRVSVLCPGAVLTPMLEGGGFNGRMVSNASVEQQRALFEPLGPIEPGVFAKEALRQVAKDKEIIVVPSKLRLLWWLERMFPSLPTRIAHKQMGELLGQKKNNRS